MLAVVVTAAFVNISAQLKTMFSQSLLSVAYADRVLGVPTHSEHKQNS